MRSSTCSRCAMYCWDTASMFGKNLVTVLLFGAPPCHVLRSRTSAEPLLTVLFTYSHANMLVCLYAYLHLHPRHPRRHRGSHDIERVLVFGGPCRMHSLTHFTCRTCVQVKACITHVGKKTCVCNLTRLALSRGRRLHDTLRSQAHKAFSCLSGWLATSDVARRATLCKKRNGQI